MIVPATALYEDVLTIAMSDIAPSGATLSLAVGGVSIPPFGVPLAVAVLVMAVPASISSCVTV